MKNAPPLKSGARERTRGTAREPGFCAEKQCSERGWWGGIVPARGKVKAARIPC
jgi:hypothetical protein